MSRFAVCLPFTLAMEAPDSTNWSDPANYSNDPRDMGGQTFNGLTKVEVDAWRISHNEPQIDVRNISQAEGYAIYEQNYWEPHCDFLAPGLDLCVFDTSVNQGPTAATRILQLVLGVATDGIWGPITQAAATAETLNIPAALLAFTAARKTAYHRYQGFPTFGNGWINRATNIGADALSMTQVPEGIKTVRKFMRAPRVYHGYGLHGWTVHEAPTNDRNPR